MKATLIAVALLCGCATQKQTYLPDGRVGYAITCSGTDLSWADCYDKAGQACKDRGYEVIAKDDELHASGAVTQYGGGGGTFSKRSMVIACK